MEFYLHNIIDVGFFFVSRSSGCFFVDDEIFYLHEILLAYLFRFPFFPYTLQHYILTVTYVRLPLHIYVSTVVLSEKILFCVTCESGTGARIETIKKKTKQKELLNAFRHYFEKQYFRIYYFYSIQNIGIDIFYA